MNAPTDRALLNAILRRSFSAFLHKVFHVVSPGQIFVPGWYIQAIAYQLERLLRGEIRRLIINMPPRSLKSVAASVAFPAFLLGHDPTRRVVCGSYSGELAHKHSNDFRKVISDPFYRELFPETRIGPYKDNETEIEFTAGGFRLATSTGGTLTGRGGGLIILDDPLKPADAMSAAKRNATNEWYKHTVISRPDDKRIGAICIVMQRLHVDDLTGFVLGQSDEWTVLSLPAIAETVETVKLSDTTSHIRRPGELLAPEREPLADLEEIRRQMGSELFSAQYQQAPMPPGGAMIKRHWVRRYTEWPSIDRGRFILQSWDTAAKGGPDNDWTVCTTWLRTNDFQWYLVDVLRERYDYPALKLQVVENAKRWQAQQVLVEESGTAIALLSELNYQVPGLTGVKPEKDKITRMSVASARFEAGQVFLPERASWLPVLEAELFAFPGSHFDDQIDSISQAINHDASSSLWTWIKLGQGY